MKTEELNKLVSAVTEFDRKQSTRRGYNPNALGIYLERVFQIESAVDNGQELRSAVIAGFSDRIRDHILRSIGQPVCSLDELRQTLVVYVPTETKP